MRQAQARSTHPVGLLALVLLFALFLVLLIVFSQQLITSLSRVDISAHILILLVAVTLPLVLMGVIVYQITRLIRERTLRVPGARFKTRLLLFFGFIALFSSIPQAMLSLSFINSTINFWLEARVGDALMGSMSISLDYYQDKLETLRSFGRNAPLSTLLRDVRRDPDGVWKDVRSVNAEIDFLQVFDGAGVEICYRGHPEGRVPSFADLEGPGGLQAGDGAGGDGPPNGLLPKEDRASLSIMRYLSQSRVAGEVMHVVSGVVLSEGFDDNARRITESLEAFNQLGRYRQLFRLVILVFYFFFSLPIFLLSILVSFLLADEIIQPIVHLEEATRRVAEGDFSFRILSRSNDELSVLVGSFNRMIGELSSSRRKLVQAEKISAWQDIAQRLAHEIKNPLTPIKLSAQRILKKYQGDRQEFERILEPAVSAIIEEVENLDRLLVEFREFARLPGPRPEETDLVPLIQEVAQIYAPLSGEVQIDFSRVPPATRLKLDRNQMKQVFANLFRNAIQAMPDGGQITVRTDLIRKERTDYCRIWIRDTGEGIAEDSRAKIFEPYFTTKKGGTGLGLAIVERVIFDHNGSISFETQKGVGTTFIIDLPLEQ